MSTISEYINVKHGITADAELTDHNPNIVDDADWQAGARHWLVTLHCGHRSMVVPFSQGSAHTDEPTAEDVLDCLASDASSVANEPDWLAWAREMGYESIEDADKARRIYQTIEQQSRQLIELLGQRAYDELLWETERL